MSDSFGFSYIDVAMWRDPAYAELSAPAKLLFVYSFTSSRMASMTGFARATEHELRAAAAIDDVRPALDELAAKPMALYDFERSLLWCVNRVRYALRSRPGRPPSEKTIAGIKRWLQDVPAGPLLDSFWRQHGAALGNHNEGSRPDA